MKSNPIYISELLVKKLQGTLSSEEELNLNTWINSDARNQKFVQDLFIQQTEKVDLSIFDSFDEEKAYAKIKKPRKSFRIYWSIAASLLAIATLAVSVWIYQKSEAPERFVSSTDLRYKNDVLPAKEGAFIQKANGDQIQLDENTLIAEDGKISNSSGEVLLAEESEKSINNLVVPAGYFFRLDLPDGSRVWVNAKSTLGFPSKFDAHERRVTLTGEAYFEVVKDAKRPFFVTVNHVDIQVLGTHFNVNSYRGLPSATLVEGKIAMHHQGKSVFINPGEVGIAEEDNLKVKTANISKVTAWKNNIFLFESDNIVTIATELKTWYDLEISVAADVSLSQTYTGEIKRDVKLSEVLRMLELASNLDFRVEANKLLILNKKT